MSSDGPYSRDNPESPFAWKQTPAPIVPSALLAAHNAAEAEAAPPLRPTQALEDMLSGKDRRMTLAEGDKLGLAPGYDYTVVAENSDPYPSIVPGNPDLSKFNKVGIPVDPSGTGEVRVTDPETGGQKGKKAERFDLLPPGPMAELSRHYGKGAEKYEDNNYRKGYDWSLSVAAMMRHINLWQDNEDFDPETGSHHMAAVAFHALALIDFHQRGVGTDDRFKPE